MKASVHNIRDELMQDGDVYIGRKGRGHDGYFGNPFPLLSEAHRATVLSDFEGSARYRIKVDSNYRERVKALHGKRLFCFCAPKPCHGDVLSTLAAELNGDQL